MAKILPFTGDTYQRIEPDQILEAAKGQFKEVIVIGMTEDDDEDFRSSTAYTPLVLWMLERAKRQRLTDDED